MIRCGKFGYVGQKGRARKRVQLRKSLGLEAVKSNFHGCYSSDGVFAQKSWCV
jgi:hypothetical protein